MLIPPEVAFDRFFQEYFPFTPSVRPEEPDLRLYRGRDDLSSLLPTLQQQLRDLQETFKQALGNEKQGVPGHVDHPPFHVDFVASDIQNALAFRYGDYSFIAITIPLIFTVSDVSLLLSQSADLAALLGIRPSGEAYNELQAVLFNILIAFIVAHEWTHHVHGHVYQSGMDSLSNEILNTGCDGSIEAQVKELAADGYATFHVLANYIGSATVPLLALLQLDVEQTAIQGEVLFSLFVIAVAAYLFVRPAPDLSQVDVYRLTHPPQAVRMEFLMKEAMSWCGQNRPELQAFMKMRFRDLINGATEATLGMTGAQVSRNQTAFLITQTGLTYIRTLAEGLEIYKQSLRDSSPSTD